VYSATCLYRPSDDALNYLYLIAVIALYRLSDDALNMFLFHRLSCYRFFILYGPKTARVHVHSSFSG